MPFANEGVERKVCQLFTLLCLVAWHGEVSAGDETWIKLDDLLLKAAITPPSIDAAAPSITVGTCRAYIN